MRHDREETPDRRAEQEHGRTTKRTRGEGPFVLCFAEVEVNNGKAMFPNCGTQGLVDEDNTCRQIAERRIITYASEPQAISRHRAISISDGRPSVKQKIAAHRIPTRHFPQLGLERSRFRKANIEESLLVGLAGNGAR